MKIIHILFIIIIALVAGYFVAKNQQKIQEIQWIGFYYKNAAYETGVINEAIRLDKAPKFDSIQDCMTWGRDMLESAPQDGFECAYGCRADEFGLICKDSTKMITGIIRAGYYK